MNSQSCKPAAVAPSAKPPQPLTRPMSTRLMAYASMAGAGMVACAIPAQAKVIYTPVHSFVDFDYHFDLNHDGIDDFFMSSYDFSGAGAVNVHPLVKGNRIVATQSCRYFGEGAAALSAGAVIGPTQPFQANASCLAAIFTNVIVEGAWLPVGDAYLGLAFVIDGKTHFGWARVHVSQDFGYCGCIAAINGYAYETIPGKPIVAGDTGQSNEASLKPGSLGMLALGATAVNLWRRK